MHFYENLFDSLFVFFRNVLAMLGLVFALGLALDLRRSDFAGSALQSFAQPRGAQAAGHSPMSSDEMVEDVRQARAQARSVLKP